MEPESGKYEDIAETPAKESWSQKRKKRICSF